MAGPKITSVDISRLQECKPELLAGLSRPETQKAFEELFNGSDLKVDEKTGEVIASAKAQKIRDVIVQAESINQYIKAANGDNTLTLQEAQAYVASDPHFQGITAEAFLADAQTFIEKRWGAVCDNLKRYSIEYPLQNLIDNLTIKNDGVYKEEFEQGRMSFSLLKSVFNVPTWAVNFVSFGAFTSAIKVWDWKTGLEKKISPTYMGGDNLSMQDAYNDHLERTAALEFLQAVLNEDIDKKGDKGDAWHAFKKDPTAEEQKTSSEKDPKAEEQKTSAEKLLQLVEKADEKTIKFERQDGSVDEDNPVKSPYTFKMTGKEAAKILREQLDFEGVFDLVTTADKTQRYNKAISYAEGERPGKLGLGGGHAVHGGWRGMVPGLGRSFEADNLFTDEVNNLYFARSILNTVTREGNPDQRKAANDLLYTQLSPVYENEEGKIEASGSLAQKFAWGATAPFCGLFNLIFHTDKHIFPYRAMSDEDAMYAPEEIIRGGLVMWQGPRAFRMLGEAKVWGGTKLEAWRAAGKYSEQTTKMEKAAWVLQRGALGVAWVPNKAWGIVTVRPFRNRFVKWFSKAGESSETTKAVKQGISVLGKYASLGLAAYAFDDYTMHTATGNYAGPTLDITSYAQLQTLDPLPPEKAPEVKKPEGTK